MGQKSGAANIAHCGFPSLYEMQKMTMPSTRPDADDRIRCRRPRWYRQRTRKLLDGDLDSDRADIVLFGCVDAAGHAHRPQVQGIKDAEIDVKILVPRAGKHFAAARKVVDGRLSEIGLIIWRDT